MRIVIDLQGVQTSGSRNRGIGRYSKSLTRTILRNKRDHEVLIALNGSFPDSIDAIRKELRDVVPQQDFFVWRPNPSVSYGVPENRERRLGSELYRETFLSSLNPDIVHISSLFEGLGDDAVVSVGTSQARHLTSVTLYDLIPYIHPATYLQNSTTAEWYYQRISALRRADLLLGISQSSSQEAVDYLGFDPSRVVAVGTAADPQFRTRVVSNDRQEQLSVRYGLRRPFVMYTGGLDHRKNVEGLIKAFAALPPALLHKHQLAIVCSVEGPEKRRLLAIAEAEGLSADAIVLTGFVADEDLIDLYNLSRLFVFPSWHEGFGLPALEAMHCGAPTIASDRSSLPEVIGLKAALFDPFDVSSITQSMEMALENESHRKTLIANAASQSAKFSWDEVGKRTVDSFEELLKNHGRPLPLPLRERRRLAFCSPLPPSQSGIADVSKEIIPFLSHYYRIDAVVQDEEVGQVVDSSIRGHVDRVVGHSQFLRNPAAYDRVIYNLGNSQFHLWMFEALKIAPGVVILHDFFLSSAVRHQHFLDRDMDGWAQQLFDEHGPFALLRYSQPGEAEAVVRDFPCNRGILESALGVIVHSDHARHLARRWFNAFEVERWCRAHLPRERPVSSSPKESRSLLGIEDDRFIVASFGMLNRFKLNDRLVRAFSASRLADNDKAILYFVGGEEQDYRRYLLDLADNHGLQNRVVITGWTSSEDYDRYLSIADVAVQLRTDSRGETSAAVLDCLNHGCPTVANANGAMAEIDPDVVVMLPDEFREDELTEALDRLHDDVELRSALADNGRQYVAEFHAPRVVAKEYFAAIEKLYVGPQGAAMKQMPSIGPLGSSDAVRLSKCFGEVFATAKGGTIFLDVSFLVVHDARSGIQRVVRNILSQLVRDTAHGCRVEPVYFDPQTSSFYRAAVFSSRFFDTGFDLKCDPPARFRPGDSYVALDLEHDCAIQARAIVAEERRKGVSVCYVVYDLLPLQFPEAFPARVPELHERWLDVVADGDRAICISRAVADELIERLRRRTPPLDKTLEVSWFHLGAEMDDAATRGESHDVSHAPLNPDHRPTFLMVGTIEPRKGHRQVLHAFEQLWAANIDCRLVMAGGPGWKMDAFVESLQWHPEWGVRLFWFDRPSDSALKSLYAASDCLIAASIGEGFGLPIVEAALHQKPVIARDIPVFREVAGPGTLFFGGDDTPVLAEVIPKWLKERDTLRSLDQARVLSWKESAAQFLAAVRGQRPYVTLGEVIDADERPEVRGNHLRGQVRRKPRLDGGTDHDAPTTLADRGAA